MSGSRLLHRLESVHAAVASTGYLPSQEPALPARILARQPHPLLQLRHVGATMPPRTPGCRRRSLQPLLHSARLVRGASERGDCRGAARDCRPFEGRQNPAWPSLASPLQSFDRLLQNFRPNFKEDRHNLGGLVLLVTSSSTVREYLPGAS
jgi:hypothetical protein